MSKNTAKIFIEYISFQFRVLFSKYEQKLLLYLILNFNKFFIKYINIQQYNTCNNLILLQLIITGR